MTGVRVEALNAIEATPGWEAEWTEGPLGPEVPCRRGLLGMMTGETRVTEVEREQKRLRVPGGDLGR